MGLQAGYRPPATVEAVPRGQPKVPEARARCSTGRHQVTPLAASQLTASANSAPAGPAIQGTIQRNWVSDATTIAGARVVAIWVVLSVVIVDAGDKFRAPAGLSIGGVLTLGAALQLWATWLSEPT